MNEQEQINKGGYMLSVNFQKYEQTARQFMKEVADEIGTDDLTKATRIFSAVMHGLRDVITPQESLDLVSQLPPYIQTLYINDWKISDSPMRIKRQDEFLSNVQMKIPQTVDNDLGDLDSTRRHVEAVFRVLMRHVSEGEIDHIKAQLTNELVELLEP